MHPVDLGIFFLYLLAMLGVGFYFYWKNTSTDDFFVGGRRMGSVHLGLSVAATDVGGGFSIGLGGLGFTMGLSGSWLLFTGLLGAWISAVLVIPRVFKFGRQHRSLTFPQFLGVRFDHRVALFAGIISAIGYLGFTSSQILAGAKLASSTFEGVSLDTALWIMGAIAIVYTALGGLKAVIYTDTVQWIVLMSGLLFVAMPLSFIAIGGMEALQESLSREFLSLSNLSWQQVINWMVTIIPIWFIAMTLYQRIYSAKSQKVAQRGWFIAGLFEYPMMAFTGVILGMFARVAFENGLIDSFNINTMDPEMGVPILLRTILPVGLMGIVLAAYFSAIMSTADSCLMASSGNLLTDVFKKEKSRYSLRYSQILTLGIGILALMLAWKMENVLELVLLSYSFMVSGLIVPVLAALFTRKTDPTAAVFSMVMGGATTLIFELFSIPFLWDLDPIVLGITVSGVAYGVTLLLRRKPGDQKR